MHQDTHEKMADAAAEALKHPGEEPDWKAALGEARKLVSSLMDAEVVHNAEVATLRLFVCDLRDEVARMKQEAATQDDAILKAATMADIREAVIAELKKSVARWTAERDHLQARASRTIWERVKDVLYGRD